MSSVVFVDCRATSLTRTAMKRRRNSRPENYANEKQSELGDDPIEAGCQLTIGRGADLQITLLEEAAYADDGSPLTILPDRRPTSRRVRERGLQW
ncbi:hypothetical protein HBB16_19845 [Pseudonocardia sp. MCCB 268]|nr:hypothetical protein [Pseudonocardia cytotoxica]